MKIKENDVYWLKNDGRDENFRTWARDNQLVVFDVRGELRLSDTYWMYNWRYDWERSYTLEQALEKGELVFLCNLDDLEKISKEDTVYYSDEDIVYLTTQHNCKHFWFLKKGSERSKDKMLQILEENVQKATKQQEYAEDKAKRVIHQSSKLIDEILSGNLDVYISREK